MFHVEQKEVDAEWCPPLFVINYLYLPNFISKTLMSAGETPGIRDA